MTVDQPREIALKILYDINEKGAYSNISINKYLEGYELRDLDKAFITELVYGTVKWRLSIDWIIQQFSSIKLKKLSPWILNILRLGVYQLFYTDKIPQSAACNESVNLAKRYGHSASSRFVNGVLRNIARNKENIKYPDDKMEEVLSLAVRHSHPEWMVRNWLERFGREFTGELLTANNGLPDFSIRVNTLKTTRDELKNKLKDAGLEVLDGKYMEDALIIRNPSSISKLKPFHDGLFQVQDESSMLVGRVLDPKPGELVVDVCSAPGGKATHIAQLMRDSGCVIARDIHEHKLKLIEDAVRRLELKTVKTELFDATFIDENLVAKADRVLVDAPCSGLGIIRRKPDIKWAKESADKKEIINLQTKILSMASKYVKPGGVLVYSTCTIEPEENEGVVKKFIAANNDFETVDISPLLPDKLQKSSASNGYIQLYPNTDGIDGFFMAKMVKRG